jgi:hypothetical protein
MAPYVLALILLLGISFLIYCLWHFARELKPPKALVLYRCDLKVAEMIVCRKDQFIRRAVPSALPYEAWREGNDSSWNPPTTYPAIERSASEPRGDGAAASIKVARGQG